MDKAIRDHRTYVEKRYRAILKVRLDKKATSVRTEKGLQNLIDYHNAAVTNFQHERAIHLRITLFFVGLTLFFFAGTGVLIAALSPDLTSFIFSLTHLPADLFFFALIILINVITLCLTLAYVWHYYRLENGLQSLYELTKKLYELTLR